MHIPSSRASHLQTNKTPQKEHPFSKGTQMPETAHTRTNTHAHACHLHRGPCGVSFKCISLSETHGSKRFCFPQQKIRGDNFTVVVLSLTLSLSFQPALSSPPLPVRIYSIYLWKAGSRERCISRNEVRDQISLLFLSVYPPVSRLCSWSLTAEEEPA